MLCVTFHASVRIVLPVSALAVDTDFAIVSVVSPSSSFTFSCGCPVVSYYYYNVFWLLSLCLLKFVFMVILFLILPSILFG